MTDDDFDPELVVEKLEARIEAQAAEIWRLRGMLHSALYLMRGDNEMSLVGSDHWLWAEEVRAALDAKE